MEFEKKLSVEETNIPGLLVVDLSVHGDSRGWFKENWQREKLISLGIPDINIVQNNISFNAKKGTTRGIHAEPWDKYVSVATGSIFGAWVDLREGDTFGEVFTCEIDPSKAIFVPRGVGNSFQALEDDTAYTYLVNAHWSEENKKCYTFVNLADPELAIEWPIPLSEAELSNADKNHPFLEDVRPMLPKRTMVIGSKGQLGKALADVFTKQGLDDLIDYVDRDEFDISDPVSYENVNWDQYDTVINACAYTAVDAAETEEGRRAAWLANAEGPALLAKTAIQHDLTIVHVSSDYVFDGCEESHSVDEHFSPLGVYGQTKAAGDLCISIAPKHYIVRTSWVIGDGKNFVRTMMALSDRCADPDDDLNHVDVVNDQFGKLTFTKDLAEYMVFLLEEDKPFGTYNFTNPGEVASWYEIARMVFDECNGNPDCVNAISTREYDEKSNGTAAPRPTNSALSTDDTALIDLGSKKWNEYLVNYISGAK